MTSGAVGGEHRFSFVIEDRFRHDGARRIPRAQEQNVVMTFHTQSPIRTQKSASYQGHRFSDAESRPGGASELSPALQRWEKWKKLSKSRRDDRPSSYAAHSLRPGPPSPPSHNPTRPQRP